METEENIAKYKRPRRWGKVSIPKFGRDVTEAILGCPFRPLRPDLEPPSTNVCFWPSQSQVDAKGGEADHGLLFEPIRGALQTAPAGHQPQALQHPLLHTLCFDILRTYTGLSRRQGWRQRAKPSPAPECHNGTEFFHVSAKSGSPCRHEARG